MELTLDGYSVPRQGVETLAQLAERALRDFLGAASTGALATSKRQIVLIRSRMARYKKLFEGGLISEDEFFRERKGCETELAETLSGIQRSGSSLGDDVAAARLGQQIAQALREVQEAGSRIVFISYRRDDAAYIADRLWEHLRSRLGDDAVFRDTSSIEPGDDFVNLIETTLERTRVCLVLIGKRWRGAMPDGASRLDQLDDFVRMEVGTALARRVTVVPVLVEGVRVDELVDLPADIDGIRSRNAISLRPDPDFAHDVERLTSFVVRRLT